VAVAFDANLVNRILFSVGSIPKTLKIVFASSLA